MICTPPAVAVEAGIVFWPANFGTTTDTFYDKLRRDNAKTAVILPHRIEENMRTDIVMLKCATRAHFQNIHSTELMAKVHRNITQNLGAQLQFDML